jgi:HAD superfamily hydrolase (TIGR01509 family)
MSPDGTSPRLPFLLALDVDGVLLDSQRGGRGPWQDAFGERFDVDARHLDETLFAAPWADVVTGRRPVESALADALRELGWEMSVETALNCWFEEDFVVEPAVLAAATAWSAQGVRLALVSNQEPRRARFLEQRLTPLLSLHGTAFSGDLGAVKSDLAFYDQADDRLGVAGQGSSVVFLDDTAANVETAVAHGWTGIHFTPTADWHGAVADALETARGGSAQA